MSVEQRTDGAGEPAPLGPGVVTLVEGSSFCVCGRSGDIDGRGPQGLFFRDARVVSEWRLRVGGHPVQVLSVMPEEPFRARFVSRLPPEEGGAETAVLVERDRSVAGGMEERLRIRNLSRRPVELEVVLDIDADFADVFAVKAGHGTHARAPVAAVVDDGLAFSLTSPAGSRGVRVTATEGRARHGGFDFTVRLAGHATWSTEIAVTPTVDGAAPRNDGAPVRRMHAWRRDSPRVYTDQTALRHILATSLEDLGALRIFDPDDETAVAVAAGAPWFMALFGRDSLLSSYLALTLDPTLALGTLRTLARRQGTRVDPVTEEEPGRILHETRFGADSSLALGDGRIYYGSVDATPLFVVVLAELARWGVDARTVAELLSHADRALEWVERYGDRDGDGFVEYARISRRGLVNQGWKDSHDAITFADGTLAEGPIALCEVQGYVYSAYVARAHFATEAGDEAAAERWGRRAAALYHEFNEKFWLPDRGWYALALDGDKRPIDALASNMGHCLWAGLVDPERAPQVVAHLMSPEMFSGWGVRTLATSMGAYNPMSYHNGSVWPHDNALLVSGLLRYGFVAEAQRVATAILDAAAALGWRLPELFGGLTREDYPQPVPYPTSCSPQAWASATPVHLVAALLRVDPSMARRQVWFAPAWPQRYGRIIVDGLRLADTRVRVEVGGLGEPSVTGLPPDVELIREPRPALAAILAGSEP